MIDTYLNYQPNLGEGAWVHSSAVVLGRVQLAQEVSVWPNAVIRGDVNDIFIGKGSNVQDGVVIHATHPGPYNPKGYATHIGEEVTIGHNAILHGCTIGNRVLIGMGAVVLDGTTIPDNVIIAAGTLVPMNKILKSNYLYVGSPAKPLRKLTEEEKAFLSYSASYYIKLKQEYQK